MDSDTEGIYSWALLAPQHGHISSFPQIHAVGPDCNWNMLGSSLPCPHCGVGAAWLRILSFLGRHLQGVGMEMGLPELMVLVAEPCKVPVHHVTGESTLLVLFMFLNIGVDGSRLLFFTHLSTLHTRKWQLMGISVLSTAPAALWLLRAHGQGSRALP